MEGGGILRVGVDGNDRKPGFITSGLTPEISSFEVTDQRWLFDAIVKLNENVGKDWV